MQAVAHTFLELASRHYPERLGTFYLVDAPSIFTLLWNALQPFIDPATRTKIRLIPCAPTCPSSLAFGAQFIARVPRHRIAVVVAMWGGVWQAMC